MVLLLVEVLKFVISCSQLLSYLLYFISEKLLEIVNFSNELERGIEAISDITLDIILCNTSMKVKFELKLHTYFII